MSVQQSPPVVGGAAVAGVALVKAAARGGAQLARTGARSLHWLGLALVGAGSGLTYVAKLGRGVRLDAGDPLD